jgi:hypothetical protein
MQKQGRIREKKRREEERKLEKRKHRINTFFPESV